MTQPSEAPRCEVVVGGAGSHRELQVEALCGLPLEPTGGPCVETLFNERCGMPEKSRIHANTFVAGLIHPYISPLACPVHGRTEG